MKPTELQKLTALCLVTIAGYLSMSFASDSIFLASWTVLDRALFAVFYGVMVLRIFQAKSKYDVIAISSTIPYIATIAYVLSAFTFLDLNIFSISSFSKHVIVYLYLGLIFPFSSYVASFEKKKADILDKLKKD